MSMYVVKLYRKVDNHVEGEWRFAACDYQAAFDTKLALEKIYVNTNHEFSCSDYRVTIETINTERFQWTPDSKYTYNIDVMFPRDNMDEFHTEITRVTEFVDYGDGKIKSVVGGHELNIHVKVIVNAKNASDAINMAKALCEKHRDMLMNIKRGDVINND